MSAPQLLIFDDGQGDFGPLTDLRPVFDLRTGGLTTRQRIEGVIGRAADALRVPPALAPLVAHENPAAVVNGPLPPGPWLMVNGRCVDGAILQRALELPESAALSGETLLAARVSGATAQRMCQARQWTAAEAQIRTTMVPGAPLIDRPWHILQHLEGALAFDLGRLARPGGSVALPAGVHRVGEHPLHVAGARLMPGVVLNAEHGPIHIGADTVVGAGSVIEGPCFIHGDCTIAPLTLIRAQTVIGPHCKVAGEISCSIFHGYSNKAHLGFVGHSLVGQWVNLGADTNVSNLKNTYGTVRVQLAADGPAQDTGRVFCGPILGDLVRTAIGSRIPTGACLATGAMVALSGFAPKYARRFGFYTDTAPQGQPGDMDKVIATAAAMMKRRTVTMPPALEARLRALA